ncbi:MAG: hypothetical protein WB760_17970 [Xanthobacteraceae bacterium]
MNVATILRRTLKILATIVVLILISIFIFDPPPFRLRDIDEIALSVPPPPKLDGLQHRIDIGLACALKLESTIGARFGRPEITVFDWLRRQSGKPKEKDVHLEGSRPTDLWAFKVDRTTNMVCYQKPRYVEAGMTDPYCGPKIIHEDVGRLVAVEDRDFTVVRVVYFDKKTYLLQMTEIDETPYEGPGIEYFECY